jgi:hypothetical protein
MTNKAADGLRGKDNEQDTLRDRRQGAYDAVGNSPVPDTNQQTLHEQAQHGADVRGDPIPMEDYAVPEGLSRERKGPYGKTAGRGDTPKHVPGPSDDVRTDGKEAQQRQAKMQQQKKAEGERRD